MDYENVVAREYLESVYSAQCDVGVEDILSTNEDVGDLFDEPYWTLVKMRLSISNNVRLSVG